MSRTALLLGATGLIGGHCLELLLRDLAYERVITLGRRALPPTHPKLEQHVVDFDHLDAPAAVLRAHDVFCCLGTTIRKAGSEEAFRKVDFTYAYEAARLAASNRAEQYLLVSSMGANRASSIFYNRVKGEVEEAVSGLPFRGVVILRPSLVIGERSEFRFGERIAAPLMRAVSPLLLGPLRRYRPIAARAVAIAMICLAKERQPGVRIVESDRIARLAAAT